jgi:cytochrome P450
MTQLTTQTLNGPSAMPLWVRRMRTLRFIFHPLDTLDARARQYGDNFRITASGQYPALIYVSSPEALEAIFTAKPEQITAGRGNEILKALLGEHGIVLLEGDAHQRQRQLLMPPFHGDRMRSYGQIIRDVTSQAINQWTPGQSFAVRPAMQSISLQVILSAVFGLHEGERYEQVRQTLAKMLDGFGSPVGAMFLFYPFLQQDWGSWSPWGRFLRQQQRVNELLYAEIADRRRQPDADRTDILALLLAARDAEGQPMSDVELRDELVTLLFAGHETTASALAWALYWIAYLPEVREKLLAELDTLDADADPSAIARLPYLSAVCQETLRIYPIAINAFPRILKQPLDVAGYRFEPSTIIVPSIYLAHHRSSVYPEPKQFRPERFLERQFSPYEYLPFGGGNRRCIGAAFALFEMKLVLFTLLSHLDFALVNQTPIRPVRRGLTVAPSDRLRLVVTGKHQPRSSPSLLLR